MTLPTEYDDSNGLVMKQAADMDHTPGPWEYVASNEHHGPYVTSEFGSTVADCYVMTKPGMLSRRNGGESEPIHHLGEMADANARLISAAPDLLAIAIRIESAMDFDAADHPLFDGMQAELLAAIAKATGAK